VPGGKKKTLVRKFKKGISSPDEGSKGPKLQEKRSRLSFWVVGSEKEGDAPDRKRNPSGKRLRREKESPTGSPPPYKGRQSRAQESRIGEDKGEGV